MGMDVTGRISTILLDYAENVLDDRVASFGSFINSYDNQIGKVYDVDGLGPVEIVDYLDFDVAKNYDGWSEKMFVIFKINGTYYKATGTYTSFIGSEWSNKLTAVTRKKKFVVYYE